MNHVVISSGLGKPIKMASNDIRVVNRTFAFFSSHVQQYSNWWAARTQQLNFELVAQPRKREALYARLDFSLCFALAFL